MQGYQQHMETAQKMGLNHPIEALLCAPDRYEDYVSIFDDLELLPDDAHENPIALEVSLVPGRDGLPKAVGYRRSSREELYTPWTWGCFRLVLDVEDVYGTPAKLTVFGATQHWKNVPTGDLILIRGKVQRFGNSLYISDVELAASHKRGRIVPVYLGEPGKKVTGAQVQAMIDWVHESDARIDMALQTAQDRIRQACAGMSDAEILSANATQDDRSYTTLLDVLADLHHPQSVSDGEDALKAVARICALALQCRAHAENTRLPHEDAPIANEATLTQQATDLIKRLESKLGYPLTNNQREVALGVTKGLALERPLNGLLSGEVGSGKTHAYGIPAAVAHLQGARVAIMAPTQLLANQIANGLAQNFGPDVAVERVLQGGKIRNPEAILVGTKGLTTVAARQDYVPDFLICDEQHKMDTAMREALVSPSTHTLDVSATPIPRSLALSLYEGVDFFSLDEQPVKRNIQTHLVDDKGRDYITHALRTAIDKGERAAIVYTLVDRAQGTPAASVDAPVSATNKQTRQQDNQSRALAVERAQALEKTFPGKVALLHGKLPSREKEPVLDEFRSGKKPLMVTTTIFETGIDVPDVSVLVIRDAHHLGASQLHQLRGRLARNGGDANCFLFVEDIDSLSEDTYERLELFTKTLDGYSLAVSDMMMRGSGDLTGLQQKGKVKTVFRGIKLSIRDLIVNQSDRLELVADQMHEDQAKKTSVVRQRQASLFHS